MSTAACNINKCDSEPIVFAFVGCIHEHVREIGYCFAHSVQLNYLRRGELYCSPCWNAGDETALLVEMTGRLTATSR